MKNIIFVFLILIPFILFSNSFFEHQPLESFAYGEKLNFKVNLKRNVEFARFYFRYDGIEEFQVRNMEKKNGYCFYKIDTSSYASSQFEYYFEIKIGNELIYLPENAPSNTYKVLAKKIEEIPKIPDTFPSPQEEEVRFQFPLDINGDGEYRLAEKDETSEERLNAGGNIRIYPSYYKEGKISIDLDSNFSLTNNPLPEEKNVDLSNMVLKFSKENNTINIGDISINESEYSIYGLGRRGINYLYEGEKAYINLFDISSQEKKGFKGFGIPKKEISIFGAAFGLKFFNDKFSLKTIYLSGKDDPSEGINVGSSSFYQRRKGNLISIIEEAKIFDGKLNIKGEFAKSNYNGDLEDENPSVKDKAYKFGTDIQLQKFSFGVYYNYIGKDFNPIGFQFFTNDRKGLSFVMGFNLGSANINANYSQQEDNVEETSNMLTTKNGSGSLGILLPLYKNISVNLGYRRDKQNTYQGNDEVEGQDSLTNEFSGSISFNIKDNSNILISIVNSSISSESMPETESSNNTINLGGAFRSGRNFFINPSIGYSISKNEFTNEETKTYNGFLSGEIYFIQSILSLNFSTGFSKAEAPMDLTNESFNFTTGLSFNLGNLVKKFQSLLSLKGNYIRNKSQDTEDSDYKAFIQLSLSI